MSRVGDVFSDFTRKVSNAAGSWQAFALALSIVLIWTLGGFYFGFTSELYQLLINSLTTVITFLMVFLIQSSSNRDVKALHLKLDDLLCSISKANEQLIDIEQSTDEQIEQARKEIGANKKGGDA